MLWVKKMHNKLKRAKERKEKKKEGKINNIIIKCNK
jgi:hypothetical protein